MDAVELEIPPRSVYVGVIRLALASLARAAGMDEESVDDLKIAVSEACTNAVLSNEEAGGDLPVTVSWRVEDDHAVVEVADRGSLYDARDEGSSLDSPSGRVAMSAVLLGSLVEDFELIPRVDGGTCARFAVPLI
jgi:anti-sigma regulatory factor (Ser/Thr protein kinase)